MVRWLVVLAVGSAALACVEAGRGHEGEAHSGFVATVSGIEPFQLGLLVTVLGGHERLSVRNLTRKAVVIFGEDGQPALRLAPGESGSVADPRMGSTGPPPVEGEFVKNWRIPGEAGGERFEIVGFLGYRPPDADGDDASSFAVWSVVLVGIAALVGVATLALAPRRRKGEG